MRFLFMNFEWTILDGLQSIRTPFGDVFMPFVSFFGNAGWFWVVTAILLLCFARTRKTGAAVAIALVFDVILCNMIIKPLVARPRPYEVNTLIELIVQKPMEYSFPSGHSAASFAAATALALQKSKLAVPALIFAALIAFSRLYLYVHYPTDVLGGILLGAFVAVFASILTNYIWRRKFEKGGI